MTSAAEQPDRRDLEAELAEIEDEYWSFAGQRWQLRMGQLHVQRHYGSQTFAKLFVLFNATLWIAGAVLIFFGETAANLGIAVVVGATFSFGTFLTEVWSQSVDREQEFLSQDVRDHLDELRRRRSTILRALRVAEREGDDGPDDGLGTAGEAE